MSSFDTPLPSCPPLPRIGVSVKQQFTEEEIYKDRDSQIAAIEKTFEDAQKQVSRTLNGALESNARTALYL